MTVASRKFVIGLILLALVVPVLAVSSASAERGNNRNNNNNRHHGHHDNDRPKCSTNDDDDEEELPRVEDRGFSFNSFNRGRHGHHHNNKPTCVTATPATAEDPTCDQLGFYIIPVTQGVNYTVDGNIVAAGNHTVPNGTTVTIVAVAQQGYAFVPDTTTSWTYTITAPVNCTTSSTVTTASTTPTPAQVKVVPTGGVYAGGGGAQNASAALAGLVGSVTAIAVGLVRKFTA